MVHTARRSPGRDYAAQWKALNGANPDFRVASTTGYQDIESVAKGKDDYEVVITFKNDFGDWPAVAVRPALSEGHQHLARDLQHLVAEQDPRHGGPVQVPGLRPDGQDDHDRPRRRLVGR
ncbi:hypothetical protein [Nonomuraea dietziae]|uniref:hypothetical protein n=1 Tax=Nonomuraea dietziae TaxID=65515 RepID=UPI0031D30A04